mmetsp:Transcript_81917/g.228310  ORF Transcript_81917/g.228310 Transcript_81917/m.228310 type:complete len:135 (-) Transcript_81917:190-594(-)
MDASTASRRSAAGSPRPKKSVHKRQLEEMEGSPPIFTMLVVSTVAFLQWASSRIFLKDSLVQFFTCPLMIVSWKPSVQSVLRLAVGLLATRAACTVFRHCSRSFHEVPEENGETMAIDRISRGSLASSLLNLVL